jgi:hypothetical protein
VTSIESAPARGADGLDPAELETCLRVLAEAEALPPLHPDAVRVRRAGGGLF